MRIILFHLLFWGTCIYAFRRGGPDERRAALTLILGVLASLLGVALSGGPGGWNGVSPGLALADLLVLGAFVHQALRSPRYWPLAMAGLQLSAVAGHGLKFLSPGMTPWQYWLSSAFWSWPMLIVLIIGTARARQR